MPPHGAEGKSWDKTSRWWALQRQAAAWLAVPIGETQRERSPAAARSEAQRERSPAAARSEARNKQEEPYFKSGGQTCTRTQ
jgi:hypothetical protein